MSVPCVKTWDSPSPWTCPYGTVPTVSGGNLRLSPASKDVSLLYQNILPGLLATESASRYFECDISALSNPTVGGASGGRLSFNIAGGTWPAILDYNPAGLSTAAWAFSSFDQSSYAAVGRYKVLAGNGPWHFRVGVHVSGTNNPGTGNTLVVHWSFAVDGEILCVNALASGYSGGAISAYYNTSDSDLITNTLYTVVSAYANGFRAESASFQIGPITNGEANLSLQDIYDRFYPPTPAARTIPVVKTWTR